MVTNTSYQGSCRNKRYGVAFTWLQTRAVHIELALSLSTVDFLNAASRFVSRRSRPKSMFSDCGTNFVGANSELKGLITELVSDDNLTRKQWTRDRMDIQSPLAPHMGGIWESMVKLTRRAIQAAINSTLLTDKELPTVLSECESMLNNRPLAYIKSVWFR